MSATITIAGQAFEVSQPPALDIDDALHPTGKIGADGRLERRIVWNLLRHLERSGFAPHTLDDGDAVTRFAASSGLKDVMELVFNLDDCIITVANKSTRKLHWLRLVLGNGVDLVSDWGVPQKSDGFAEAMDAFCDIVEELA